MPEYTIIVELSRAKASRSFFATDFCDFMDIYWQYLLILFNGHYYTDKMIRYFVL